MRISQVFLHKKLTIEVNSVQLNLHHILGRKVPILNQILDILFDSISSRSADARHKESIHVVVRSRDVIGSYDVPLLRVDESQLRVPLHDSDPVALVSGAILDPGSLLQSSPDRVGSNLDIPDMVVICPIDHIHGRSTV